jgi:hypothetical protein
VFRGVEAAEFAEATGRLAEGDHLLPLALPHGGHGGVFAAPLALSEGFERRSRRFGRGGLIDRLDRGSRRLEVLPARQIQQIADQIHVAGRLDKLP